MIINFKGKNDDLIFCFVDNTWQYNNGWTKELIKNQSDYTIANVVEHGFTILQGFDEDALLKEASKTHNFAVVFSTGTEFINGYNFFEEIIKELDDNFLIKGHLLDRGNAYYELHHQCYLVNLKNYKNLGFPTIGKESLGEIHYQSEPIRSKENLHDNYTPRYITRGNTVIQYDHKLHGWNIISISLEHFNKITAFDNNIRNNKIHLYPENQKEFLKHINFIYLRENYCREEFIHKQSTESIFIPFNDIEQVLTPASGEWWKEYTTNSCNVFMYDYNQKSIDFWKNRCPNYSFIHCNLLYDNLDLSFLDKSKKTLINLSNIFSYEGTSTLHSLELKLKKESDLLLNIKNVFPEAYISFSRRACSGFKDYVYLRQAKDIEIYRLQDLTCPTWHANGDWCN